jgi:hypothetical protein
MPKSSHSESDSGSQNLPETPRSGGVVSFTVICHSALRIDGAIDTGAIATRELVTSAAEVWVVGVDAAVDDLVRTAAAGVTGAPQHR